MENGETLQQAVIRETLEEAGWQVMPQSILGIYAFTPFAGADTYHRVCIVCQADRHVTDELDPDILSSDWYTREQIEALPQRSPLILQCIRDYENGHGHDLNMINNRHIHPS